MGLLGASNIIGGSMQLAGALYGGIRSGIANNQAYKAQKGNIENQLQTNEDWYNRRYNEDATQKADAQRLLTMTEQSILNRNKQAAGAAAVMGGTEESVAASKAAGNQALADAVSQINANAEAQKAAIESQYMQTNANLNNQLNELEAQKAKNTAAAASMVSKGLSQAGASVMGTNAMGFLNKNNG